MTAHYSYSWANSIVKDLQNKYTRATDSVCKILDITPQILAKYLSLNDPVYAQIRTLIHLMDRLMSSTTIHYTNVTLEDNLRAMVAQKSWERLEGRLDSLRKDAKLEEQSIKQAGSASECESSQLTLFPNLEES